MIQTDFRTTPHAWHDNIAHPKIAYVGVSELVLLNQAKNKRVSTLLYGQKLQLYFNDGNYSLVAGVHDKYLGWARSEHIYTGHSAANIHKISSRHALVFSAPNIKSRIVKRLPFNAVAYGVIDGDFLSLEKGLGYIHTAHINCRSNDLKNIATFYLDAPYLWGGATPDGIDCSGFVQQVYMALNIDLPRDSDQQELITNVIESTDAKSGDLLFWPGHVAMVYSKSRIIHATAFYMRTVIEDIDKAIQRIGTPKKYGRIKVTS